VTPPLIAAIADATVAEGNSLSLEATFTDPDAESWSALADWGDGLGPQTVTVGANKAINLSHNYGESGIYDVTVTVADSAGLAASASFRATVTNTSPATVASASAVNEGPPDGATSTLTITSRTDPSSADSSVGFRQSFDFDNDGTFEIVGSTQTSLAIPAAYIPADGPATRNIRVRTYDQDGGYSDTIAHLNVANLPPTADFAGSGPVEGGNPLASVSFSSPTDPSPADVAAGFAYSYDFDNDGVFEIVSATSPTADVPEAYLNSGGGICVVRGRITDKDGAFTDYTVQISVQNVDPIVTLAGPDTHVVGMGSPLEISGSFIDPDNNTFSATLDLGDGSPPQSVTLNPDKTFSATGTWFWPGIYTLTVRLSDGLTEAVATAQVDVRGPDLAGTPADDIYRLRLSADGTAIEFFENAYPPEVPTFAIPRPSIGQISFNGAGGEDRLVIDSANGDPLDGRLLTVNGGSVAVEQNPAPSAGGLRLSAEGGAAVTLAGVQRLADLYMFFGARVSLVGASALLDLDSLLLAGGVLDLGAGAMILRPHPDVRMAALQDLTASISSARDGGAWDGIGLTSSAAAADASHLTGLAVMLNDEDHTGLGPPQRILATFMGRPVDEDSVLVRFTLEGDANLDGRVNIDDYFLIDLGHANGLAGYASGDFNYSGGAPDGDDYFRIDHAFLLQGAPLALAGPSALAPATWGSDSSPSNDDLLGGDDGTTPLS
jgi:hypothetical protein